MKQFLTVLLCLLLYGCGARQQTPPAETAPQAPSESSFAGMYDPDHPMEARYPTQVRGYTLTQQKVHGLLAFGADILTLSGQSNTTLTLLTGDDLHISAARTVGFPLKQNDPSLQIHNGFLSFFDPRQQKTLVLDHNLQEIRSIAVPRDISGTPILSSDGATLYYCTPWAVVAWDLESGIRRTVKETLYDSQKLTALHLGERILECTVTEDDHTMILLLSADNGQELHTLAEGSVLKTTDTGYFLSTQDGFQNLLIFSGDGSEKELLLPKIPADIQYYLPEYHAVLTAGTSAEGILLDLYDLDSGVIRSSLRLDPPQTLKSVISGQNHLLYILLSDSDTGAGTLIRWEIPAQVPRDSDQSSYTFSYCSRDEADRETLEQCRQYAHSIGRKYGISIDIWEDACNVQPWDYQFTPEYLAPVLQKELELLDQRLALFPPEILQDTAAHFDGLTVCLVRKISGRAEAGSLPSPTGIQFLEDNRAFVAITTGKHAEQALYHELYHVMETHVLTKSAALDQWESLNPVDFSYGDQNIPDVYLQGQTRAFADRYSTGAPKEDRGRIFENAILPSREGLFRSEYMQRKLSALCLGIREAYGLKKYPEALPWEQYLVTPIIPTT